MKNITFILIFFSICCSAQKISIQFRYLGEKVPYVSVFDSTIGFRFTSDINGDIRVRRGNYVLFSSHVSYKSIRLVINQDFIDTLYVVNLEHQNRLLENVVVKAHLHRRVGNMYAVGKFEQKVSGSTILLSKLKLGVYIENENINQGRFVKGIKFKLANFNNSDTSNSNIEIKIFPVLNGKVGHQTINRLPIYLPLKDIKRKNKILIHEDVDFPYDGLLISFELPQVFDEKRDFKIEFPGNWQGERCTAFVIRNNNENWEEDVLSKHCGFNDFTQKTFSPSISILYQNYIKLKILSLQSCLLRFCQYYQ